MSPDKKLSRFSIHMIPEHSGFKNLRTRMSNSLDTCGLKPYAETHVNVDNVCELTSKRLRTDFYTFANSPETFAKRPLAKRPTLS